MNQPTKLFIMRKIKVGIIQQSNTADIKANLMNLAKSIEACAAHGAQLIVLQELHNSLYFCQTENTNLFDLAEPIPGPSTGFYSELAAANKVVLVTSLFEKRAPGLYHNTAGMLGSMVSGSCPPDGTKRCGTFNLSYRHWLGKQ